MNLSLHVTIGIPSSYPDSPSWAGLTARVQGCPTRPRPPDGPTGLLRHFTQQSFPRFRWHDGSRSSSELTAPVLLSDCAKPLWAPAAPGHHTELSRRRCPSPPQPPGLTCCWAAGLRHSAAASMAPAAAVCPRRGPPGRARHGPGAERGAGGEQRPESRGSAHTLSHSLTYTHIHLPGIAPEPPWKSPPPGCTSMLINVFSCSRRAASAWHKQTAPPLLIAAIISGLRIALCGAELKMSHPRWCWFYSFGN